jgi:predicted GTPase
MSKFLEYKKNILNYFDDCIAFAKKNDYQSSAQVMLEKKKKIEEDKMVVLTCGEMKRGKSSMLCALLEDEELFPVNVAVATCLVTMVSYAEVEKITVVLEDEDGNETSKIITRNEIADYVTEQGNASNYKKAKLMLIETPNP